MARNENGVKKNCGSCHGRGRKRMVLALDPTGEKEHKIVEVKCHCLLKVFPMYKVGDRLTNDPTV